MSNDVSTTYSDLTGGRRHPIGAFGVLGQNRLTACWPLGFAAGYRAVYPLLEMLPAALDTEDVARTGLRDALPPAWHTSGWIACFLTPHPAIWCKSGSSRFPAR